MEMLTINDGPSREELFDSIRRSIDVWFEFAPVRNGQAQVFSVKRVVLNYDQSNHFWHVIFNVGFKGETLHGKQYQAYYSTGSRKGFTVEKEVSFELVKGETHHYPLTSGELYAMLKYSKLCPTLHWNMLHARLDKAIPNYPLTEDVMRRQKKLPLLLSKIRKSKKLDAVEKHLPEMMQLLCMP
ncbi:MAG: hypothetical protein ABIO57_03680 [Candidatus Paceibacterota bacterium]